MKLVHLISFSVFMALYACQKEPITGFTQNIDESAVYILPVDNQLLTVLRMNDASFWQSMTLLHPFAYSIELSPDKSQFLVLSSSSQLQPFENAKMHKSYHEQAAYVTVYNAKTGNMIFDWALDYSPVAAHWNFTGNALLLFRQMQGQSILSLYNAFNFTITEQDTLPFEVSNVCKSIFDASMYLGCAYDSSIHVYNTNNHIIMHSAKISFAPKSIYTTYNNKVYCTFYETTVLEQMETDLSGPKLINTYPYNTSQLFYHRKQKVLLLANNDRNLLWSYADTMQQWLPKNKWTLGSNPFKFALNLEENRCFISNSNQKMIDVIDLENNNNIKQITIDALPGAIISRF